MKNFTAKYGRHFWVLTLPITIYARRNFALSDYPLDAICFRHSPATSSFVELGRSRMLTIHLWPAAKRKTRISSKRFRNIFT